MKIVFTSILFLISFQGFSQTSEKFIANYWLFAKNEQHRLGVPASIQLALGILISNSDKTYCAKRCKNIFKLKCFSNTCKKGHCIEIEHKIFYYIFNNKIDGWKMNNNRLKNYKGTYKNICENPRFSVYLQEYGLQPSDVLSTISKYKLHKYDQ